MVQQQEGWLSPEIMEETFDLVNEAGGRQDFAEVRRLLAQDRRLVNLVVPWEQHDGEEGGGRLLHFAASCGLLRMATCLVDDCGAEINIQDNKGETPLYEACLNEHHRLVEFLLSRGADATIADSFGRTPLMVACAKRHVTIVRSFLRDSKVKRESINLQDPCDGETALHTTLGTALNEDQEEVITDIIRMLVEAGANPSIEDHEGYTPLEAAIEFGYEECVTILEAAEAQHNHHRRALQPLACN